MLQTLRIRHFFCVLACLSGYFTHLGASLPPRCNRSPIAVTASHIQLCQETCTRQENTVSCQTCVGDVFATLGGDCHLQTFVFAKKKGMGYLPTRQCRHSAHGASQRNAALHPLPSHNC